MCISSLHSSYLPLPLSMDGSYLNKRESEEKKGKERKGKERDEVTFEMR